MSDEPMSEAREVAERAAVAALVVVASEDEDFWLPSIAEKTEAEFAPLLAAKDAAMTQFCWCAKNFPDKGAVKIHMESCEQHPMSSERDRLAAQLERLTALLAPDNVRKWWRFDDHQQPLSSWHEREEVIERVAAALTEQPHA